MTTAAQSTGGAQAVRPALELIDAWKTFGHVMALRAAHLRVSTGEVVALVGDNGAGKSTMVKVLSGVYRLDRGELRVNGDVLERPDPLSARRHGISTVFQDLALAETLDVATNMFLGQPIKRAWIFSNRKAMVDSAAHTLRELKVRVPSVRIPVGELSGGQRQGVAIARGVHKDNPIVLMDEPTAALGVRETRQVGEIIDELRSRGKAVIVISHDLEFVFEHSDRIQVMRLGAVQAVRRRVETDREEIIGLITGVRAPDEPPPSID